MKKHFIVIVLFSGYVFGQNDSVFLNEVVIHDPFLNHHYKNQTQLILNDSILRKNNASLSQVLQFETPIYFKENGLGMVSSPSFRGTSASQTAVVWNGININSSINGQTDFSTINAKTYDAIIVKSGGGSNAYGTGAIGGTIHLIDQLKWDNKTAHQLNVGYGSFDSYQTNYQFHYAKNNVSTTVGYARFQSDNDYKINNYLKKNRNGKYYFNTIDANAGVKLKNQELKFYSQFNFGKREFSLTDTYETPTMYDNQDYRMMGQWNFNKNKWKSDLKLAYTHEANQYYPNRFTKKTQDLEVNNWISKYYISYNIDEKQSISAFAENSWAKGNGTNIKTSDRNTFGLGLIYKHVISSKVDYEASIRQDFSTVYEIPFSYALGVKYQPLDFYKIRLNLSNNYRIPTFNDLFWQTGGNEDLKAEKAFQLELGNDFKISQFNLQTNVFYNDIKDMIQWVPNNLSSYWTPVNQNHVKTYGAEIIGDYSWNRIDFKMIYSYTESINQLTDKTLIYVPKHQFHINANYNWKDWNVFVQNRWVDQVYIQTDNQATIPSYWTTNLGLGYKINSNLHTNFKIQNLFDHSYQSVSNRWMPGINYQFSLNIKL